MKKICAIIFFLIFTMNSWAQERIPVDLNNGQFYVSILSPALKYESRIAANQSLMFTGGLTTLTGEDFNEDVVISLNPFVQLDFRNYYPRKKVKKQLRPNSGNFIGLVAGYNFASIADNLDFGEFANEKAFYMGPVWGIQRNYQSGIHLGLSLGAGFITGKNTSFDFHGLIKFDLGFVIGGRK